MSLGFKSGWNQLVALKVSYFQCLLGSWITGDLQEAEYFNGSSAPSHLSGVRRFWEYTGKFSVNHMSWLRVDFFIWESNPEYFLTNLFLQQLVWLCASKGVVIHKHISLLMCICESSLFFFSIFLIFQVVPRFLWITLRASEFRNYGPNSWVLDRTLLGK